MKKRFGFITNSGILSALLTLIILAGYILTRGNGLFSPGGLNNKTGEPLGGYYSHAEIGNKCSMCHPAPWNPVHMDDLCRQCHVDITFQLQASSSLHGILFENNLSLACRKCHPEHRGPTSPLTMLNGINFPHDPLGFSLNTHLSVICLECHPSGLKNFSQEICASCHLQKDARYMNDHNLVFGSNCLACHDGLETYGKLFQHDAYPFKLIGKHSEALCTQCHPAARSRTDLRSTPQACVDCHLKDNNHSPRISLFCGDCHQPSGWIPAQFDHNLASFKLEGEHINVDCISCHVNAKYLGTPTACASCHSKDDAHKGSYGSNCEACHSTNGWKPATFDHTLSAFPLTGKHLGVLCANCHVNNVFKGTPVNCFACHVKDDSHAGRFGTDCGACHTTSGWLPATFDHALSGFPLTGAHLNLACTACHSNNSIKNTSPVCFSCHGEPAWHAGSFGTDCAVCHGTSNWFATFNGQHPSININHEGASCRDCHTVNLKSATCTKCHDSNNPGD